MLKLFRWLMPREDRFFALFERHATVLVSGAEALGKLLRSHPADIPAQCAAIVVLEQEADDITRDVLQCVRRSFITPFDRSAITSLIGSMDDAIDQMNQTAKAISLFDVRDFRPTMVSMGDTILATAQLTAEALPLLRDVGHNGPLLHGLTERIVQLEGQADAQHDAGLKELFHDCRDAPMRFIVGQRIFDHLEKIMDRFEDVANEVQGLSIDHA